MTFPRNPYILTRSLCGFLQLCRKPVFLELHRADVAQRRMKPSVVVVGQPVNHLVHRLAPCFKPHAVFGKRLLQYWLLRSEWKISPGSGRRLNQAILNESITKLVCMCGCMLQPTTWRLYSHFQSIHMTGTDPRPTC